MDVACDPFPFNAPLRGGGKWVYSKRVLSMYLFIVEDAPDSSVTSTDLLF